MFKNSSESQRESIIIPDQERLERIRTAMKEAGQEKLHVLSDFDRTLTKGIIGGKPAPSIIAELRNGKYLTPDYAPRAHKLADFYRPIEMDPSISKEEKNQKMHEWWQKHFDLLIECGLDMDTINKSVSNGTIEFREGALDLIDILRNKNVPLIIMSAAPGDMIAEQLKQLGYFHGNVHIIANMFEFNERGKVMRIKEPIIHVLNKHETVVSGFPVYKEIKERKNVVLLGDGVGDVGMVEGFDCDNLIKIGFLDENVEKNLEEFEKNFDVILLNDADMSYVNGLLVEAIT